jgi:hypothetical protein
MGRLASFGQKWPKQGKGMKMKRSFRGLVLGILMLTVSVVSLSTASSAQIGIGISVRIGPPALPVYAQPICPGPGYFWTPGYWAWNDVGGYYWVPGTWVIAPRGMLWTPGYWGFAGGFYGWHGGYWGPHVGFYGGINYGFGYGGVGFGGGEWRGGAFFYNRSVTNVNVTNVTNVYNRTVIVNNVHTSFNGAGGIEARPTPQEQRYEREPHTVALSTQTEHEHAASQNKQLFASENHGRPAVAATARPGEFSGRGVERANAAGEAYHTPKMSPQEARAPSGGNNRGSNEAAKNGGHDRAMARNNGAGNRGAETQGGGNREQSSAHNNPKQNQQAQKQSRAEQKRAEKTNRAQARAEQKHAPREQRR